MEKGNYGYMKKYKKGRILSVIILGLVIIIGVAMSLIMWKTTKTIIILIPILTSLPFAKQLVALILCAPFKPLLPEEYEQIKKDAITFNTEDILFDISISQYEGILYFPAVTVRDGRMVFLYKGSSKKVKDSKHCKDCISEIFENMKNPYIVMVTSTVEDFISKSNGVKEAGDDYINRDNKMRERLFELGV